MEGLVDLFLHLDTHLTELVGAYGGWVGYYRTAAMARGSDVIYLKNSKGFVGNGCARSSS